MHVEHDETGDQDVAVVQEGEREASSNHDEQAPFDLNMVAGM
jgi:hypothetical protein